MKKFLLKLTALAAAMLLAGCGYSDYELSESSNIADFSYQESETEAPTDAETSTEPLTEEIEETSPEITEAFDDYSDDTYVEYHFRTQKQLEQHFEKHGGEFEGDFNYETAEDYEAGASDVINNSEALFKTEAEDGDGVYYIEDTNEFVVLSTDGYIRTYFRPNAGIDYFNRQ